MRRSGSRAARAASSPGRTADGASRERSQAENRNRHATSNAAPAPKNIPVCAARETKPRASIASPAAAKTIPIARARRAPRASPTGRSMACAVRSARGDSRATARSDTTTQSAAARTPAPAPIASERADTCSSSSVVPTAPRHHVRRPKTISWPYTDGANHAERAAHRRKDERLGQEHAAHVRDREAGGAQDADLPQPLLDAKPEEQDGQQQRGHHEEEAEVGEVLAEVGRARGCLDRETPRAERS